MEWAGSTFLMPTGAWFDRSEFILWPYPAPLAVVIPAAVTETNIPAESGVEPKTQ